MACACSSGGGSCCKSSSSTAVSNAVPLPKHDKTKTQSSSNPVWQVDNSAADANVPTNRAETLDQLLLPTDPLNTKCSVHEREGQCCKDLKGEDERYLISPEVVRDV